MAIKKNQEEIKIVDPITKQARSFFSLLAQKYGKIDTLDEMQEKMEVTEMFILKDIPIDVIVKKMDEMMADEEMLMNEYEQNIKKKMEFFARGKDNQDDLADMIDDLESVDDNTETTKGAKK